MNRTINGYRYDLDRIQDVHETAPGHWEGRTVKGDPFFILGGTRANGGRHEWYTMCPAAFQSPEPQPVRSLAEGLRKVDEAIKPQPEPEVQRRPRRRRVAPAVATAAEPEVQKARSRRGGTLSLADGKPKSSGKTTKTKAVA
jgi:hypothetical protein